MTKVRARVVAAAAEMMNEEGHLHVCRLERSVDYIMYRYSEIYSHHVCRTLHVASTYI